ncbi:MAG: hypothetical protein OHK0023_15150 [Anaerolineae bacterium]
MLFLAIPTHSKLANAQGMTTPTLTHTPTLNPFVLGEPYLMWDFGLEMRYPVSWSAPLHTLGQVIFAPDATKIGTGQPNQPLVALGLIDPSNYGLIKDAPFDEIAFAASRGGDTPPTVVERDLTTFAGLDAGYVELEDEANQLRGRAIAFMLPDGRYAVFTWLAPIDQYATYLTVFSDIRLSATLIRPNRYTVPALGSTQTTFTAGQISFTLPQGWQATQLTESATRYADPDTLEYPDTSGFANGPQLVILTNPLQDGLSVKDALAKLLEASESEAAQIELITLNGKQAASLIYNDVLFNQHVRFVAVPCHDGSLLCTLRWTSPGALQGVLSPLLENLLASVKIE